MQHLGNNKTCLRAKVFLMLLPPKNKKKSSAIIVFKYVIKSMELYLLSFTKFGAKIFFFPNRIKYIVILERKESIKTATRLFDSSRAF